MITSPDCLDLSNDELTNLKLERVLLKVDVTLDVSRMVDNCILVFVKLGNSEQCDTPFFEALRSN